MKWINVLAVFVVGMTVLGIIYLYPLLVFSGMFDTKYTQDEAVELFKSNEKEFADVINYFKSICPNDTIVNVQLESFGDVDISLIVNDSNNAKNSASLSGYVDPEEDKSYPILAKLHWSKQTLITLRDKLEKTGCNYIASTEIRQKPIILRPYQNGWVQFSYLVFTDSLPGNRYGNPISNSPLGSRVFTHWVSSP